MEIEGSLHHFSAQFSTIAATQSAYTVNTATSGYYFAGNETKVWWGSNYGPWPDGDYAPGYYKGACPNGHAVVGDSCSTTGYQSHAIVCGQGTLVSLLGNQTGSSCYARNIARWGQPGRHGRRLGLAARLSQGRVRRRWRSFRECTKEPIS